MINKHNNNKIALIVPPSLWTSDKFPLGLMSISSFLTKHGYENIIIDSQIDKDYSDRKLDTELASYEEMIVKIAKDFPIVGITCMIMNQDSVLRIVKKIKQVSPETKVIVGGSHPTLFPDFFLKNNADFVVYGEGEYTMAELAEVIFKKKDFSQIKGIFWMQNGTINHNPPREFINLDELPLLAFDKVNMDHYLEPSEALIRGVPIKAAMVMASRGCPYACTYCANERLSGRRVRYRSRESIFQEVKLLKEKYGVEGIWFADDTLTVNPKHIDNICSIMRELNMIWGGQARVDTITEDMVKKMKESDCVQLDFGIESGSDRILKDIANKGTTVEMAKKAFNLCDKFKIRTLANLMMGFPTETREEMQSTLDLALELKPDRYFLSILAPLPATKMWDMVGVKIPPEEFHNIVFHGSELTDKYNKSEVKDIMRLKLNFSVKLHLSCFLKKVKNYGQFIKMLKSLPAVPLGKRLWLDWQAEFRAIKSLLVRKILLNKKSFAYRSYLFLKKIKCSV